MQRTDTLSANAVRVDDLPARTTQDHRRKRTWVEGGAFLTGDLFSVPNAKADPPDSTYAQTERGREGKIYQDQRPGVSFGLHAA